MKAKVLSVAVVLAVMAFLASARQAKADTLTLDNGGSITMGGVYVGPYNFTGSNGLSGSLQLVCDTFQYEVHSGEYWDVTVNAFPTGMGYANPSATTAQIDEVGWLVEHMFQNLGNTTLVGQLQWAIWEILDPTDVLSSSYYNSISSSDKTQITYWASTYWTPANIAIAEAGNYSNLVVYEPVAGTQVPVGDGPPQEYIGIVPEPAVLSLLAIGLFGLIGFRRRFAY